MKRQALAIAAATMLTIGLGIANASEQSLMPDQTASPDISACSDPNLCPQEEMINEGNQVFFPDAQGGILVGQPSESMNDVDVEELAEDEDTATAEQASDDSSVPDVIIFVQ
ncbi:MAG TPA: hypothetical protein VGJ57_03315 [Nitrospirales bacterium]|jgi:hypothetical protein